MDNEDELCPCGSGKVFEACCQKEYEQTNKELEQAHKEQELARKRIKDAMGDPQKAKELKELLKQFKK